MVNLIQTLKSQLFVETYSESVHHTFLDYFLGGCELNFMVAIDFTGITRKVRMIMIIKNFKSLSSNLLH